MFSVVIPAHDEGAVIEETLATLLTDAEDAEFEVVVVCNGCRDHTADIARSFGAPVRVIEIPEAAKWQALNVGDDAAIGFPRIYMDADVLVTAKDARALARALSDGPLLAAALTPTFDKDGCSLGVRAEYAVYSRLPVMRDGLTGAGVYGLSREGRARFGRFPAVMSDDQFICCHFDRHEMGRVPHGRSVVRSPRTLRDVVARKTRAYVGNEHLRRIGFQLPSRTAPGWLHVVRTEPRIAASLPVYVGTAVVARLRGRRRLRDGQLLLWDRDEQSRVMD